MSFGVTLSGFINPTDAEIEAELVADFQLEFGDDITLNSKTFLGQELAITKRRERQYWDSLEDVYYSRYPSTSTGVNLDRALDPIVREGQKKSITTLRFAGDDESAIIAGSLAETADGIQYETISDAEIEDSSGGESTVDVDAIALIAGESGNQPIGTIIELPVTIPGIDSVTNIIAADGGAEIEEDPEYHTRAKEELQTSKSSSVSSIRRRLLDLEGILQATVIENTTDAVVEGLRPRSIQCTINGAATDQEIADAIYRIKAGGIETIGDIEIIIIDGTESFPIRFARSQIVPIYVDYIVDVNSKWVSENEELLKARALEYIGGVDPLGISFSGLEAGEDVLNWKLPASIFNLGNPDDLGIIEIRSEISKELDPSSSEDENISILPGEEAKTDYSNINILVNVV